MTLYKKRVLRKNLEHTHTKRLSKFMQKVKEVNKKMEIKELCDRCFKDIEDEKTIYKYGSAVYCEKCHEEIEKELLEDMQKIYFKNKQVC